MIDWIKHNLGVAFVFVTGLLAGALLFIFLEPGEPSLPTYDNGEARSAYHQPGGRSCEPISLATIADRTKAMAERDRCADAAEEHRLKSDDLVQQTRTADATADQTALSYNLARVALAGTIVGLWTLMAAALAAYFARNAAYAARDSYDAFTAIERADVVITLEGFSYAGGKIYFSIVANNLGRSAALMTTFGMTWSQSGEIEKFGTFFADVKHRIIPAASREELKKSSVIAATALSEKPYLWVLIKTRAPVVGYTVKRFGFLIYEKPMTSHRVSHEQVHSDEIAGKA